jgi:hypothetical protein
VPDGRPAASRSSVFRQAINRSSPEAVTTWFSYSLTGERSPAISRAKTPRTERRSSGGTHVSNQSRPTSSPTGRPSTSAARGLTRLMRPSRSSATSIVPTTST